MSDALLIALGACSIATFSCDSDSDAPSVESLGGWLRAYALVFSLFGANEESCGISYDDSLTFSVVGVALLSRSSEVVGSKQSCAGP